MRDFEFINLVRRKLFSDCEMTDEMTVVFGELVGIVFSIRLVEALSMKSLCSSILNNTYRDRLII